MIRKLPFHLELNQKTANLTSYFILAVMMTCISISFIQLMQWMMPGWTRVDIQNSAVLSIPSQWGFLPFVVFLISLESIFSRPIARELEGREKAIYHFAEWITIAIAIKLVLYIVHGFNLLPLDLARWQNDLLYFFEGEYFPALLCVAFLWGICRFSANNIDELNIEPEDQSWDLGKLQNSRTAIRGRLVDRLLWSGIIMVIMAAGARIGITGIGNGVGLQEPVINIMVFFFLALVLFSQTQYSLLYGQWFWHKTPVHPLMTQHWIRYSLILFALLAVIAFLLPTRYSMGLLETLNYGLSLIIYFGSILIQLLLLPIIWLLSISGCTRQPAVEPTPQPFASPAAPIQPPLAVPPLPWVQLLQSILFWVVFIGVIGYAITQFIRQNPQLFALVERIRIFRWIRSLWNWASGLLHGASRQVSTVFKQARIRLFAAQLKQPFNQSQRLFNFRQLNPRQQVIFYYLRLIDRSGEQGIQRRIDQTPYQYAKTLQANLPEVEEDIDGITESFIEARYSRHDINQDHMSLVQRFWRNITRSLKQIHKPRQPK